MRGVRSMTPISWAARSRRACDPRIHRLLLQPDAQELALAAAPMHGTPANQGSEGRRLNRKRSYEVPGGIVVEDERADDAYDKWRQEQVDDEKEKIQQPQDS